MRTPSRVVLVYEDRDAWKRQHTGLRGLRHRARPLAPRSEIDSIAGALTHAGYDLVRCVYGEDGLASMKTLLKDNAPGEAVFWNLTDGSDTYVGSLVPAVAQFFGHPYVASSTHTQALCQFKHHWKAILRAKGVSTPGWRHFRRREQLETATFEGLSMPVFVKAGSLGDSSGLDMVDPIAPNTARAKETVAALFDCGIPDVLVEEFIDGREYAVGMVHTESPRYSIAEQCYNGSFLSPAHKSFTAPKNVYSEQLVDRPQLAQLTRDIVEALRIEDYCKVDIRQATSGEYFVTDVNAMPFLTGITFQTLSSRHFTSFDTMIGNLVQWACTRKAISV